MKIKDLILIEGKGTPHYRGILYLSLDNREKALIRAEQQKLPPEAKPLPEKSLHVTLVHQSKLKPVKNQLKQMDLSTMSGIDVSFVKDISVARDGEKMSWYLTVMDQEALKKYVKDILNMLQLDVQPDDRVFHVSIANLTGRSSDSVAIVGKDEEGTEGL